MKQIIINLETPHIKALEKAGEKDAIEQVTFLICYSNNNIYSLPFIDETKIYLDRLMFIGIERKRGEANGRRESSTHSIKQRKLS